MKKMILFTTLISALTGLASIAGAEELTVALPTNPAVRLSIHASQCSGLHESRFVAMLDYPIVGRTAPLRFNKQGGQDGELRGSVTFDQTNHSMLIKTKLVSLSGATLAEAQGPLSLLKYSHIGSLAEQCLTADEIGKFNIAIAAVPARGASSFITMKVDQCQLPVKGKAVKKFVMDASQTLLADFDQTNPTADGGTYRAVVEYTSRDSLTFRGNYTSPAGEAHQLEASFNAKTDANVSSTRSCLAPEDLNQYVLSVEYEAGTDVINK